MPSTPYLLGIVLAVLGLGSWLTARWLSQRLSRVRENKPDFNSPEEAGQTQEALIVIQAGGRVVWLNEQARALFGFSRQDLPSLEALARKVRPPELFLNLCAGSGQELLALDGHTVEARALRSRLEDGRDYHLILLRETSQVGELTQETTLPAHMQQTFLQLTQAVAASLDLNETLQAIFDSLERLLPADIWEITLWDAEAGVLIPYRRLSGYRLERISRGYALDEGYSGYLARTRRPLLLRRVEERPDLHQAMDRQSFPLRSYMGVPLVVGKELIGTLELGSLEADHFQPADLELLKLIAGQAAIAIHHTLLYRQEQRRAMELAGLAQLAQAFSAVQDSRGLYERLVNSILPLVPVNVLGFVIYNENTRCLEAQAPFVGMPADFLEMYRIPVAVNSPLERVLLDQDILITENAAEDPRWGELGLHSLAVAAGLRETILVPLVSAGRVLGYLQASNRLEGGPFTQDERRLLMIVANQVAPIIENATLVQQSRQRAQRAEGLRRIASLASSAATLDEILKYSLQELARLLRADVAVIFLLNPAHTTLELHRPSQYGEMLESEGSGVWLLTDDPQFPFTVTSSQDALRSGQLSMEMALIPFYQRLRQMLGIESAVAVPLVVRNEGIGEIWIGSRRLDAFDHADLQLVSTAASQLAGVVEQAYLTAQTDQTLRQRLEQLTALNRITRELSASLDLEHLMNIVYEEALRLARADCGTLVLFDLQRADFSEPTLPRLVLGDPLPEFSQLERRALREARPILVPEVVSDVESLPHEGIRSLLVVPIYYRQYPAGLIHLHAAQAGHFGEVALDMVQSLAAQAGVALANALQYEDQVQRSELVRRQLETLGELYRVSAFLWPEQSLDEALAAIARAITQATPFRAVLISLYDAQSGCLVRKISRGLTPEQWEELRAHTPPWSAIEALLQPEFRLNNLYYIPGNRSPVLPESLHWVNVLRPEDELPAEGDLWHPDDLLLAPLLDTDGRPLGLISVDDPSDGCRPDRAALEALEIFASQAALAIARHNYLERLRSRLARYEPLEEEASLVGMDLRWQRVRHGLHLVEEAARQESPQAVLRSVAQSLLEQPGGQAALIAAQGKGGLRLLEVVGEVPEGLTPEALLGQRNPLSQALLEDRPYLVANLAAHNTWRDSPLLQGFGAQGFMALPFHLDDKRRAGVLALFERPLAAFDDEDHAFYAQLCRQVSIGLQNLSLLEETRRRLREVNLLLEYSRKLGSLAEEDLLQALCSGVLDMIPGAEAAWVALRQEEERVLVPCAVQGYRDPQYLLALRFALDGETPGLPVRALQQGAPIVVDEVQFLRDYPLPAEGLLHYRRANGGRLPVSAMAVPLGSGERSFGALVVENFDQDAVFDEEARSLALSLVQQTALALENARLFQAAGRRLEQLQALTQVTASMAASLSRDDLLASLLEWLQAVVRFDTAVLWLREGDRLHLVAAHGFSDGEQRVGLSVRLDDSRLFQEMLQTEQAILVADVRQDERFSTWVQPERLCWLGIPLIVQSELLGILALEKAEAGYYTPEDVQVAMTFASQAAIALEKAHLLSESLRCAEELDQRSERLALLYSLSNDLSASLDADYLLKILASRLQGALGSDRVAVVLAEEAGSAVLVSESPASGLSLPHPLPALPLLERLRESRGAFIASDVGDEPELNPFLVAYPALREARALLMTPLATAHSVLGWLLLAYDRPRHFAPAEIELARTICNQAAVALQNARLYTETHALKEDLERRVEQRTTELHQANLELQTLLRVITELSAGLDIHQVLTRALDVLNEALGAEGGLVFLAQGELFGRVNAEMPPISSLRPLIEPLHREIVTRRLPLLLPDIAHDEQPYLTTLAHAGVRSLLALPLILGEEVLGSLVLVHRQPEHFEPSRLGLVQAAARQMSITLSNADLFNLIRDQAESLGKMLREQQIEASRSRAILEAVADGVMVTDDQLRITLFNASAERILGLRAPQVLEQPLERFSGLFGEAGHTWIQAIQRWSEQAETADVSETFAGQMILDDQRVVAIHVAPVFWRDHFLGTVSIFRDVTYQVQVDRLKSEFLANVSHELRTPLTAIKGYVDVMLMGAAGPIGEQQARFLRIVKENAERLIRLVNDLLDVSRIEAGRVELNRIPLDLGSIAREAFEALQARAREEARHLEFSLDIAASLPAVYGDRERVRQVLESLLSNSYHYTPENGRITLRVHMPNETEVQVDVQDTGIGIPLEDQPRIFERFYRGNNPLVMATAGTGLGLALAKILVEMQGGRIWFTSKGVPGEGSTFSFTLPIVEH